VNKHSSIDEGSASGAAATQTVTAILVAISFSHLLNDTIQSLFPAIYPWLKDHFALSYTQIGLITLTFQGTASLLQPVIGIYTDRKPQPYSLAMGMGCSLIGLLLLAFASTFAEILLSAALVGLGSAVFHPESSRVARMASGGRYGLAQSTFQVGGNVGTALGPLAAAFIVIPGGQGSLGWFSLLALVAIVVLSGVGRWYKQQFAFHFRGGRSKQVASHGISSRRVNLAIAILLVLTFSKFFYMACITSYYTFYLIHKFGVSVQSSQIHLFVFLVAVAAGTLLGGAIGDRFGRKLVIWISILGVLPFTLALPYADLFWIGFLSVPIGFLLASAFPAIIVFAQELMPGRVGMIAGVFFGFAFGMGGIGAAVLGTLADWTSIDFVFRVCAFLPAIGLLTIFLPNLSRVKASAVPLAPKA
jgi:FSR family fosmidomycin resistance protein-like MFS transporter